MTDTLTEFKKQQNLNQLLSKLATFLNSGIEFGIKAPHDLLQKLSHIQQQSNDKRLKLVLIGGFSEGKTSIAAAWLGKIDTNSMKIDTAESSNEISFYSIDDDYLLIDTPGLYGYKEKHNYKIHDIEKYKDITKKYVSEAHIVLYVMNSSNPIKESHKDDLIWLFKELNLLSRTVFVLSRFDEVADVEDEDEYKKILYIKQYDVKNRLQSILNLSNEEANKLSIVGVSANPFNEGTEYWLQNPEEFSALSHISTLQNATKMVIAQNGQLENILQETHKSVFFDIKNRQLPELDRTTKIIIKEFNEIQEIYLLETKELRSIKDDINSAKQNITNSINNYFSDLIKQLMGTSMETINDFLISEVGEDGCIINNHINQIFNRETSTINAEIDERVIIFNTKLENIDSAFERITKQGINHLVKNVKFDNKTILAARDGLREVGKFIGLDLGKQLKFKPHGAGKLAHNLNTIVAFVGIAMELWDTWQQHKKQESFDNAKKEWKDDFSQFQKQILEFIQNQKFIDNCFPMVKSLQMKVDELHNLCEQQKSKKEKFEKWKQEFDVIEGEFKIIH